MNYGYYKLHGGLSFYGIILGEKDRHAGVTFAIFVGRKGLESRLVFFGIGITVGFILTSLPGSKLDTDSIVLMMQCS